MTELEDALEDEVHVRTLKPTSTFSSFVLWNADRPVDENKDEYLRSLTEWTKLSAVVSASSVTRERTYSVVRCLQINYYEE